MCLEKDHHPLRTLPSRGCCPCSWGLAGLGAVRTGEKRQILAINLKIVQQLLKKKKLFGGKKAEIQVQTNFPFSLPHLPRKSVLKRRQENLGNELLGKFDTDGSGEPLSPCAPR